MHRRSRVTCAHERVVHLLAVVCLAHVCHDECQFSHLRARYSKERVPDRVSADTHRRCWPDKATSLK